jgi:hypothetical protein
VGHRYAGAADVSEGIGRHNSTIAIIDFDAKKEIGGRLFIKPRLVAMYTSNKIAPDLLAYEIQNGGQRFGNCLMAPERNQHGWATLTKLKEIYFNIYKDEKDNLGWLTTFATKPVIMHDLRTAINDDLIDIPDEMLKREIVSMPSHELNKVNTDEEDETGGHYDRIMALAIAWQLRSLATPGQIGELKDIEEKKEFNRYLPFNEI